jgi:hypothetical protein
MNVTRLGLCPVAGFGTSSVKPWCYIKKKLVNMLVHYLENSLMIPALENKIILNQSS